MTPLIPKSAVTGVTWPALPGDWGSVQLALIYQLEQSQWWPPQALLDNQFRQLRPLLRHAAETVPFYGERLRDAGLDPGKPLTAETWIRLPVLTRREVQGSFDALQSQRIPKAHGALYEVFTSGSTGMPVRVVKTALAQFFWRTFTLRSYLWHGYDLGGTLAAIRPTKEADAAYPDGQASETWGISLDGAFATGASALLDIGSKIHEQVDWLQRQDPDYLITYPSNLGALTKFCRDRDIRLPRLRCVQTVSELLYPEVREACREVWGVPVTDTYSTEEVGYIGVQCPESDHLHVLAEGALVEVVDERGAPCAPGKVGQVVVTPLHNFAMPLIRYAVGDLAEAGSPCACGRGLPVLARVLGRLRSMVRLPNGELHYANFQDLLKGFDQINQFQIVRVAEQALEMKLVAARELEAGEAEALAARVRERFKYSFAVAFSYHDEIERSAGGKFEDYRSDFD